MKTRTALSTLLAGLLVAALAVPAFAGPAQTKKQTQSKIQTMSQAKKAGTATSGQGTMTQDRVRAKDASCQQ